MVATAAATGIPVPAFGSSLSYYDALRSERLPAASPRVCATTSVHTPTAGPTGGLFHTLWGGDRSEVTA